MTYGCVATKYGNRDGLIESRAIKLTDTAHLIYNLQSLLEFCTFEMDLFYHYCSTSLDSEFEVSFLSTLACWQALSWIDRKVNRVVWGRAVIMKGPYVIPGSPLYRGAPLILSPGSPQPLDGPGLGQQAPLCVIVWASCPNTKSTLDMI